MGKSYMKEWDAFFEEVVDLFLADAFKAKLEIKYKNSHNIVIVKATDNRKVYLYKCRTEPDIKRLDALVKVAAQILANLDQTESQIIEPAGGAHKKKNKKRV